MTNAMSGDRRELQLTEGRAGDQDRFAERDDQEELAPLRHVRAADGPLLGRGASQPWRDIADGRCSQIDGDRDEPEQLSLRALRDAAGEPERSGQHQPDLDPLKVAVQGWVIAGVD